MGDTFVCLSKVNRDGDFTGEEEWFNASQIESWEHREYEDYKVVTVKVANGVRYYSLRHDDPLYGPFLAAMNRLKMRDVTHVVLFPTASLSSFDNSGTLIGD